MNYRHAFHAGNFADCVKHALLLWCLRAMQRKAAGVFVLDTHAGIGRYDLSGDEARRTGEWHDGIGRLLDQPPALLAEYVTLAARDLYPGSPTLLRAIMRPVDRLACCELHPADAATLRHRFARDSHTAIHQRDGYEAIAALLPPRGLRRALVLIDPPYEREHEAQLVAAALATANARMPGATLLAWYPIKHRAPVRALQAAITPRDAWAAELWLRAPLDPARLNGCGLIVVNPPFGFAAEAGPILEALLGRLGSGDPGQGRAITRLTAE